MSISDHFAAIRAGKVTRTNVIGMRKAINTHTRQRQGWSISRTAARGLERVPGMESALERRRPVVVGELHDTGLAVLGNRRHKRALAEVADLIPEVKRFRLVRFDRVGRGYAQPVYRAETRGGRWFEFRNVPWQAGGNGPEVLAVSR